jgi:hypothetical protein
VETERQDHDRRERSTHQRRPNGNESEEPCDPQGARRHVIPGRPSSGEGERRSSRRSRDPADPDPSLPTPCGMSGIVTNPLGAGIANTISTVNLYFIAP